MSIVRLWPGTGEGRVETIDLEVPADQESLLEVAERVTFRGKEYVFSHASTQGDTINFRAVHGEPFVLSEDWLITKGEPIT